MPRTINFLGSVALLVSSITGPSLVVIPLLFQQAGWLTPLLTFAIISLLSGAAALFIVEAMSSIEGNESFEANIEFTTIAHLFLGKRWHIVVQILLYLAMQTLVIASLLESFQSMDAFLISVAHKSCAISFTDGWVCTNQIPPNGSSAFSGYILGSFGTLITLSLILPLSLVHLVDNIIFQVASFLLLLIITLVWIIVFAVTGLNVNPIPVVGQNQSTVVGFVLSNFSFVTTIPAWVNNTHSSVNIRLAVWISIFISCLIYIPIGWMGGSAFILPNNATLLQILVADKGHGALSTVAHISSYLFPLAVLITSIPVFAIVIRYNLLRGNICSNKWAIFWSAIFPWLIVIPFQTNDALATILNWASLIFTSPSNLLIPFILFLISKRHTASAVLDESVSPVMPPVSELVPPSTPITQTTPRELTATPENIPVVIITESTDGEPDSTEEVKPFVARDSSDMDNAHSMSVMNRVSSPSKHRYYGREILTDGPEAGPSNSDRPVLILDTAPPEDHRAQRRRPSLSVSLSPSLSLMHASHSGMDEFLLMSPTSPQSRVHSVRSAFSMHSLRSAASPPPPPPKDTEVRITIAPASAPAMPVMFKAFPSLSRKSPSWSLRISAIGFLVSAALVLTAIVYDIVEKVNGG